MHPCGVDEGRQVLSLAGFPGGWRVVAAGCRPRGQRPYDCVIDGGGDAVRALFLLCLMVVGVGLVYFSVIGLLHR
jgi:hypothetical protein